MSQFEKRSLPAGGTRVQDIAQQIVRQHRIRSIERRLGSLQPIRQERAVYKAPWYRAINWRVAGDWICTVLVALCGSVFLIHFLIPFVQELRWE
jgi:ABC-type Fe3+ transport system permease subunit